MLSRLRANRLRDCAARRGESVAGAGISILNPRDARKTATGGAGPGAKAERGAGLMARRARDGYAPSLAEGEARMSKRITILNGPNLNLLGEREPEIYGATTLADIEAACRSLAQTLGVALEFRQTNHEGVMVDWIQEARLAADALIINPAGLSFHSVPVLDAIRMMKAPVIELHISNIHARDAAHRDSIISAAATAVICGLGAAGYPAALLAAAQLAGLNPPMIPEGLQPAL